MRRGLQKALYVANPHVYGPMSKAGRSFLKLKPPVPQEVVKGQGKARMRSQRLL